MISILCGPRGWLVLSGAMTYVDVSNSQTPVSISKVAIEHQSIAGKAGETHSYSILQTGSEETYDAVKVVVPV